MIMRAVWEMVFAGAWKPSHLDEREQTDMYCRLLNPFCCFTVFAVDYIENIIFGFYTLYKQLRISRL